MKNNFFKKLFMFVSVMLVSSIALTACDFETIFREIIDLLIPQITIPVDDGDDQNNDDDNDDDDDNGGGAVEGISETPGHEINYDITLNSLEIENPNDSVVQSVSVNSTYLSWQDVDTEKINYVAYYSTSQAPQIVEVAIGNQLELASVINYSDEIYAFRVGIKNQDDKYVLSSVIYYNPDTYLPYTNNIFYFNGNLGDNYIESDEEFYLLAHYTYIYKVSSFSVKLSSAYYSELTMYDNFANAIDDLLDYSYNNSFMETIALSYGDSGSDSGTRTFTVNLNFRGAEEPTLTLQKTRNQDIADVPYYLTVDYAARDSGYNDFATDKKIKIAPVETSEELFWAVESGATPVFSSQTSSAYLIYKKAKAVLNRIISNEMTDYYKVLSIFYFIAYNTVYDHQIVSAEAATYIGTNPYTAYTSFYLEGVFEDRLVVCDGFSKAFSLLANMEGIETVRIVGYAGGGGHAWNKVYLDGSWYVVDITWSELETEHYVNDLPTEYLSHKYFLVSDAQIAATHTPHSTNEYKDYECTVVYDYFGVNDFTINEINYNLIINTNVKAAALINYLWQQYLANETPVSVSIEVAISSNVLNDWATIVRSVKDSYNATHETRFDNDVLRVTDGSIAVVQIHNTFLNLQS